MSENQDLTMKSRNSSESNGSTAVLDLRLQRRRTMKSDKFKENSKVPLAITLEREKCLSQFEEMSRYISKQKQVMENIRLSFGGMVGEISNSFEKRGSKLVGFEKIESNYQSRIEELKVSLSTIENEKRKVVKVYEKKLEKLENMHEEKLESAQREHKKIIHNTIRNLDNRVQRMKVEWKNAMSARDSEWEDKAKSKDEHIKRLEHQLEENKSKISGKESSSTPKTDLSSPQLQVEVPSRRKVKKDPFSIFDEWDSMNLSGSPALEDLEKLSFDPSSKNVKKISNLRPEKKNKIDLILRELMQTEEDYVNNLDKVFKYFITPLKQQQSQQSPESVQISDPKIFAGFAKLGIIKNVNALFLEDLKKVISRDETNIYRLTEFAGTVQAFSQTFKLYSDYISSYGNLSRELSSLMKKNKKFSKFSHQKQKELEVSRSRITDFLSFLILPIQRIPRYNLLLRDVLRIVDEDYEENASLSKATDVIQQMAMYTNDKTLEMSNATEIQELEKRLKMSNLVQPHRKIVYKEERIRRIRDISKKSKINTMECEVVLCSDLLIVYPSSKPQNYQTVELAKEDISIQLIQKGEEINIKKDFVRRDSLACLSPSPKNSKDNTIFDKPAGPKEIRENTTTTRVEEEEDENVKKKKAEQGLADSLLQKLSAAKNQEEESGGSKTKSITHKFISVFTSSGGDKDATKGFVIIPFHQVKIEFFVPMKSKTTGSTTPSSNRDSFNRNSGDLSKLGPTRQEQIRLCFENKDDAIRWYQRIDQQINKKRVSLDDF